MSPGEKDPQAIGLWLMHARDQGDPRPLHEIADDAPAFLPFYDEGESLVKLTVVERRRELEERAAAGDRYALSMLTTGLPGDSDE